MKICKICNTENEDNQRMCHYCGSYFGFNIVHACFLIGLFLLPLLIIAIYLAIKDYLKMKDIRKKNNIDIKQLLKDARERNKQKHKSGELDNLNPYLCSVSNYRNTDGKVEKGDCNIKFESDVFIISQGGEKIENNIDSIYYYDIWDYEDDTYFKICMRSHTEYIFKSIHFEADKIAKHLRIKGVKIEDNRNE